ncbi:MAG: pyroglutamyl-peptidase I [Ruminococcaceae bacterium]|nr:pyroglutamyl-peptidase I [Oscillospiraceae bacterium]
MRILVTAFEPFGGDSVNSSMAALEALPDSVSVKGQSVSVVKAGIPVVFGQCGKVLDQLLKEICPDGVISLGMAAGRGQITPEVFAVNARYARSADNAGQCYPVLSPCDPAGSEAYRSTLPVEAMCSRMQDAGIPAGLSFTAGTYVCNDLFYHLMKTAAVPAGFIHVPQAAEEAPEGRAAMAQAEINRGILEAVTVLAEKLVG